MDGSYASYASYASETEDTEKQEDATVNNLEEIDDEFCPDSAYLAEHADKKVAFTFMSNYGEIFPGINARLFSKVRVQRLSADYFCTVVLHPVPAQTFSWPAMDPVNMEVFRDIRRIRK